MKKNILKNKIAVIGLCTLLGVASVGAVASLADETTTTTEAAQPPMNNGMYMGKITAIESGSITIETMGRGGRGMGKPDGAMQADGTMPTNASGELETPPALPANASGETETPPAAPTNAAGETETPPAHAAGMGGTNGMGEMGGTTTMTFTIDSSLTSSFSVGDMVDIISEDGVTATAISASQAPRDMGQTAAATA
ncbi:MAG: hypothetical protein K6A76_00365 [Oribacterium sp.]|nr:hypothetical protein [Oribacterium sp.]